MNKKVGKKKYCRETFNERVVKMEKKEHAENQIMYITNSAYDELHKKKKHETEYAEEMFHKYDCQDEDC